MCQDALGDAYVLFLLENKEGLPVAVVLPADTVAAQELVLPQVRRGLGDIWAGSRSTDSRGMQGRGGAYC
jgi:hypothetical protein